MDTLLIDPHLKIYVNACIYIYFKGKTWERSLPVNLPVLMMRSIINRELQELHCNSFAAANKYAQCAYLS